MKPAIAFALVALSGCGYGFGAGAGRMPSGAERVFVRPLENRTSDAEAGALVAAAIRQELARRGADGDAGASARIEGAVLSSTFAQSSAASASGSLTYRVTLVVEVRLVIGAKVLTKEPIGRSEDYVGAIDALETEGRRRVALRRVAALLARDVVEAFEVP